METVQKMGGQLIFQKRLQPQLILELFTQDDLRYKMITLDIYHIHFTSEFNTMYLSLCKRDKCSSTL